MNNCYSKKWHLLCSIFSQFITLYDASVIQTRCLSPQLLCWILVHLVVKDRSFIFLDDSALSLEVTHMWIYPIVEWFNIFGWINMLLGQLLNYALNSRVELSTEWSCTYAISHGYCTLDLVFQLKPKIKSLFRGGAWSVCCYRASLKFSEESKGRRLEDTSFIKF